MRRRDEGKVKIKQRNNSNLNIGQPIKKGRLHAAAVTNNPKLELSKIFECSNIAGCCDKNIEQTGPLKFPDEVRGVADTSSLMP